MIGEIPAKDAYIVWWVNNAGAVTRLITSDFSDDDERERVNRLDYDKSDGACSADWMKGVGRTDNRRSWLATPMGLFLRIATLNGFANEEAKAEVLREFAKIEGARWASDLLSELGEPIDEAEDEA